MWWNNEVLLLTSYRPAFIGFKQLDVGESASIASQFFLMVSCQCQISYHRPTSRIEKSLERTFLVSSIISARFDLSTRRPLDEIADVRAHRFMFVRDKEFHASHEEES